MADKEGARGGEADVPGCSVQGGRRSGEAPSAPIGLLLEREEGGKGRREALGLRG